MGKCQNIFPYLFSDVGADEGLQILLYPLLASGATNLISYFTKIKARIPCARATASVIELLQALQHFWETKVLGEITMLSDDTMLPPLYAKCSS